VTTEADKEKGKGGGAKGVKSRKIIGPIRPIAPISPTKSLPPKQIALPRTLNTEP